MILRDQAQFPLARQLREKSGAPIADVFTFLSGLYFRGKIAYANAFARSARGTPDVVVITPTRGLIDARTRIRLDDLREFAAVDIHKSDPRYRLPIERDARRLATKLPAQSEVILLGSIATGKYVDVLLASFGDRLRFPAEFVGRGDMSRGGLMLRCAADGQELSYIPVAGAIINGKRPPKLVPAQIRCWIAIDGRYSRRACKRATRTQRYRSALGAAKNSQIPPVSLRYGSTRFSL